MVCRAVYIPLLFLCSITCFAQPEKLEWKAAAGFLQTINYPVRSAKDLRKLGADIRHHFPDTLNRLRSAYLWVSSNIRYDCEGLQNKNSRWALDSVLLSRKAVCAGYVNVFRNLCESAGVECVDVGGYGRSGFSNLLVNADSFAGNHTWNAVKVGGEWKLIDVTWASGYTDEDCGSFTFHRNDWYFCADPRRFVWDHFPRDSTWQLLSEPISWQEFYRYPLLYQGMKENNIEDFSPRSVIISKKVGDTVVFNFKSAQALNRIIIRSRSQPSLYRMDQPVRTRNGYRYVYRIEKAGQYDLQIDLLSVGTNPTFGSYSFPTFTDIVYWVESIN